MGVGRWLERWEGMFSVSFGGEEWTGVNSANSFRRRVPRRLFRVGGGGSGVGNLGQGGFGNA
jgi:hypothetical protein